jgi:GT2 family glycosyltransferase
MTKSTSRIAVVILNFNGKHFLETFLAGVIEDSYPHPVVIADNNSTDGSVAWIKQHYPAIELISIPENKGYAGGYNFVLEHITTPYALLLNNDVETTLGWLVPLIEELDKDPTIGACQPKLLDQRNRNHFEYAGAAGGYIDYLGYPFCKGRIFTSIESDETQFNSVSDIFWASGAAMCVRMEAFKRAGGFDPDYFAHMEEIDLCWRMKNLGYRILSVPDSCVYHVGGGTLSISPKKTYLNFRNNLSTLFKNDKGSTLIFKLAYRLVLDGVAGLKFLFEGQALHCFAVIKAHFSFYAWLPKLIQKRRQMSRLSNFRYTTTGIYPKAIVWSYFIQKKKTFKLLHWQSHQLEKGQSN